MIEGIAADFLVVVHAAFVLFVVFGGLLVLRRRRFAWLHLPAAAWGVAVEYSGWICPLTPLEQQLRQAAGAVAYRGGFIEHYLLPVIYTAALSRDLQFLLGTIVLVLNGVIYAFVLRRLKAERTRRRGAGKSL